jgi:hypothetical protein
MYILKIKGGARIPGYIQVRDNNFTLIAYFRDDNKSTGLDQCGFSVKKDEIIRLIQEMPYGKIFKLP